MPFVKKFVEGLPRARPESPSCHSLEYIYPFVSSRLRGEKTKKHQVTKSRSFSSFLVHWRSSWQAGKPVLRRSAVRGLESILRPVHRSTPSLQTDYSQKGRCISTMFIPTRRATQPGTSPSGNPPAAERP